MSAIIYRHDGNKSMISSFDAIEMQIIAIFYRYGGNCDRKCMRAIREVQLKEKLTFI
jgi:hypothetical protein